MEANPGSPPRKDPVNDDHGRKEATGELKAGPRQGVDLPMCMPRPPPNPHALSRTHQTQQKTKFIKQQKMSMQNRAQLLITEDGTPGQRYPNVTEGNRYGLHKRAFSHLKFGAIETTGSELEEHQDRHHPSPGRRRTLRTCPWKPTAVAARRLVTPTPAAAEFWLRARHALHTSQSCPTGLEIVFHGFPLVLSQNLTWPSRPALPLGGFPGPVRSCGCCRRGRWGQAALLVGD